MNSYIQKVYKVFHELGYERESLFSKKQTETLMKDIALANSTFQKINPQIIQQIWNHCTKSPNNINKISVQELSLTISQAITTLKQDYDEITKKLKKDCTQNQKKQLLLDLYSVSNNYQILAFAFNIPKLQESSLIYQSLKLVPESIRNKERYIFSFQFTEQTLGLKIVLWITMLMLGLQVLMMFNKTHFYTLLCFCMVISIFLLNYFDATFIRFVIGNLLFSSLFDVIWQICFAKKYWNQEGDDFVCFKNSNILKFSTLFVILIAVGKLMITGILFKYRNNPPDLCLNILDADPRNNPVTKLF